MIGLIFGETSFPKEILKKIKKKKKKYLIIDLTKNRNLETTSIGTKLPTFLYSVAKISHP